MCATYFLCRNLQGKEMRLLVILLTPIACKMKSKLFNVVCRLSQSGSKLLQKPHPLSLTSKYTVLLPHGISLVVWPYCCLSETLASSFTWGAPTSMVLRHYCTSESAGEFVKPWITGSASRVSVSVGPRPPNCISNECASDSEVAGLAPCFHKQCTYGILQPRLKWSANSFLTTDILYCAFLYAFILLSVIPHFGVSICEWLPYLTV